MGNQLISNFYIISARFPQIRIQVNTAYYFYKITKRTPSKSMNQYKSIDIVGQGSFGSVYLVKDAKDKSFALKRIHVDPFEVDQALKEIDIMQKFVHPNLVKIYEYHFDQNNELLQIIMEYCEEGDLLNYFKKKNKQLTVQQILRIFKQIVQAFIVMNVKGVFHRDLKPQNILIGKGMIIKVADFGCARSVNTTEISKIDNFSLDKGTPIYASPQQLKNQKYSFKCDVWSAGCLLYFIYKGFHPFMDSRAHNTLTLIKQHTQGKMIEINSSFDLTIGKIIGLTLIYEDKQRASWRELWLSRLFTLKISDIKGYVNYLKNVTIIANWMAKEFWKIRKEFTITQIKDEVFVYFIIKFQYTTLKMALNILKKSQNYKYLFQPAAFQSYDPSQQQFEDIKKAYIEHQKYFSSIKKSMQSKEAFKSITEKEPNRTSAFSDLDNSIRAGYKILLDIKGQLEQGSSKKEYKIWVALSRWINFQKWYSFEKEPRVQKIIIENINNLKGQVLDEMEKYQMGIVE